METMHPRLLAIPLDRPGFDRFFSAWLIQGDPVVIVDTGPAGAGDVLVSALQAWGVRRVDYVLLTHIHLDHAGGLARVLDHYSGARTVCHRKAVPHLKDPSRLWAGSRKVLGDLADAYGPPRPVPPAALIPHDEACIKGLTVLETPGHAPHHLSFSYRGNLFAGEAAGNFLDLGQGDYLRPATPPRFLLEEALESVGRMRALEDQALCYAHIGRAPGSHVMLDRFRDQLIRWAEILGSLLRARPEADANDCVDRLLRRDPELARFPELNAETRQRERFFLTNSVRGYLEYLRGRGKGPGGSPSPNDGHTP